MMQLLVFVRLPGGKKIKLAISDREIAGGKIKRDSFQWYPANRLRACAVRVQEASMPSVDTIMDHAPRSNVEAARTTDKQFRA